MEIVHIGVHLKFEYGKCYVRLEYQKQPHNCPEGEEDEGFGCDLELYSADIYYTTDVQVDEECIDCV